MQNGEKKAVVVEKVNNGYKIDTYDSDAADMVRNDCEDNRTGDYVAGNAPGAVEVFKDIFGVSGKTG